MSELRAQLRLAAPLAIGQMGHHLMSVVDTAMLGRFSDEALAGAGIANSLMWTFTLLGMGIVIGMDALVPQAVGAGEHRRARALLRAGVRTAVLVGAPLTIMALSSLPLMNAFGVQAPARHEAALYIYGRLPAIIPFLIFVAARSYLQAYSVTRPLVIAVLVANLVNVAANGVLIFGDDALVAVGLPALGLPALGALGAAISTSAVTVVSMLICVIPARNLSRKHRSRPADDGTETGSDAPESDRESGPESDRALSGAIIRVGWPVGMALFAELGIFALVAILAGRLGTVPAAAHQLALTVVSFTFNAIIGIGAATSVRVGLAVGAGDHRAARSAGLVGLGLGSALMSAPMVAFLTVPDSLIWLMTDQPAVAKAAVPLFYVAGFFQLADGIQCIGAGALRGAGDTRSPMWAHIVGHYAIGLTVAITCAFVLHQGATGLWWGLAAGADVCGCGSGLAVHGHYGQADRADPVGQPRPIHL